MARCKDCIHHKICEKHDELCLFVNEDLELEYSDDVDKECEYFNAADVTPRAEVAREICCEIEEEIVAALESNYKARGEQMAKDDLPYELIACINGKINALRGIEAFVEDLKKKYTEGQK